MRAVNLISDKGGRGGAGSSNAGFALLAVLAVLVVGVAYYVLTDNTIVARRGELAAATTQATAAQQQADRMRPYTEFASLASTRVATVRALGATRFDWDRAFSELSKVVPDNVWLTSLLGTVTSGVSVEGAASGATSALRSALPNPAIELTGCTTTHDSVVRLLSRLRLMDGVVRVSLADSTKGDTTAGGSSGASGTSDSGDCRHGHANFPQFDVVVFFDALPGPPAAPDATGTSAAATTGAATTGAPAPASAQPAAATTPAQSAPASTTPAATGTPSTGTAAR